MSKIIQIFLIFFSLKNINLGAHFLIISISKSLHFLKRCPIFDTSPLHQFSKLNNSLWVCWFFGKNISNFVPPAWKLNNPYYHNCHSIHEEDGSHSIFLLLRSTEQYPQFYAQKIGLNEGYVIYKVTKIPKF